MTWLITCVDANPMTTPVIVVNEIRTSAGTENNKNSTMMMMNTEMKRRISFTPFTASAGNRRDLVLRLIKAIARKYTTITPVIVPVNTQISITMHHARPTRMAYPWE